jgi:hypothetical protein
MVSGSPRYHLASACDRRKASAAGFVLLSLADRGGEFMLRKLSFDGLPLLFLNFNLPLAELNVLLWLETGNGEEG